MSKNLKVYAIVLQALLVTIAFISSAECQIISDRMIKNELSILDSSIIKANKDYSYSHPVLRSNFLRRIGSPSVPYMMSWIRKDISLDTKKYLLKELGLMGVSAIDSLSFLRGIETYYVDGLREEAAQARKSIEKIKSCGFLNLPENTRNFALGLSRGFKSLDEIELGERGGEVREVRVVVTETKTPVVLILSGGESIMWNVGVLPEASLVGVYVSGGRAQGITGISSEVDHRVVSHEQNDGSCPLIQSDFEKKFHSNNLDTISLTGYEISEVIRKAAFDTFFAGPVVYDMDRVKFYDDIPIDFYAKKRKVPFGEKGIDFLLDKGLVRRVGISEIEEWRAQFGENSPIMRRLESVSRFGFLITGQIEYPSGRSGLRGGNSFILPRGVPRPLGEPGRSNSIIIIDDELNKLKKSTNG